MKNQGLFIRQARQSRPDDMMIITSLLVVVFDDYTSQGCTHL